MFARILDMFISGVFNIGSEYASDYEYAKDLNMPEF